MADAYLLESGADRYLLEDGSGVLLLEPFVQSASKSVGFVGNNTTLAFPSNVTAGNLIIVTQAHWTGGTETVTTPTDTLGHTYVAVAAEQAASATGTKLRSFYVANCLGGANTVTFDISGTATGEFAVVISEWRGMTTTSPLDGTSLGGPTADAAPTSGNITPSVDNCLLYGAVTGDMNNVSITEEAGWTLLREEVPAGSIPVATQWKFQTTASAEDADWTLGSSQTWVAHVAAFKPFVAAAAARQQVLTLLGIGT